MRLRLAFALFLSLVPVCSTADTFRMELDRAVLTWAPRQGLDVTYGGAPVLAAHTGEITVHTRDWQKALYRGSDGEPRAELERKGGQQILTVRLPEGGFHAVQRIIAGPGDHFRIEWRYSQDAWDDACLQLGLPKPTERFLAGSTFRAEVAGKSLEGAIPVDAPAKTTNPFRDAEQVTFSSIFGTLRARATKPLTLYDYAKRSGTFFLGYDEPLPRGKEIEFAADFELAPAAIEREGLLLSDLSVSGKVEDGVLRGALRVERKEGTLSRVRLALVGKLPDGTPLQAAKDAPVGAAPAEIQVACRIPRPGTARCALVLTALPDGKEILRTPEAPVEVLPLLTVVPNLSLYTSEGQGALLVRAGAGLRGRSIAFAAQGRGVKAEGKPVAGERTPIPFDAAGLANGRTEVGCRLLEGGQELATATVALYKAPPKANEVKIDYAHRGLIVDGLPYLPFGFYCTFPPGNLPTEETPQGFVHIGPYQRADADRAAVKEYLDRCAALGMRVHYDIRDIAQSEPSPQKWEKLRAQVEAVRDHPALLCWYLCDEPDGQGIPPARLDEAYRFVKELDPYHPITMVFCVPPKAPDYVNGMDIMMADPYPIPRGKVAEVASVTDRLNQAVGYGMPLWIVPQAFGGGEWWPREPSAAEERVMTYLALIHGATGIQYFIRRAPIGNPIAPSLWSECRRLALEGQELAPGILSAEPVRTLTCSEASVHAAAWKQDGVITLLAANTENRPRAVTITLGEPFTGQAEVLFANRTVDVRDGKIEDLIDGFGTRAYRLRVVPAPKPRAEPDPANLAVNPSFEECANPGTPDGCYVGVAKDPGASLFVDPRLAVHGGHSLRITCPADGQGLSIQPFPIAVKAGQRYRLSIWARGLQDGLKLRFGMGALDCGVKEFTATRDWAEYVLEGTAAKDQPRAGISLSLLSRGTLWLDLMQMAPAKP